MLTNDPFLNDLIAYMLEPLEPIESKGEEPMQTVKINKEKLRKVVQKNRGDHRAAFETAIEDYKLAVVHFLDQQIERARKGVLIDHFINIPQPQDHTDDYDQVLEMLDMSVDENIVLNYNEFARYVRDDWGWKGDFGATTAGLANYTMENKLK